MGGAGRRPFQVVRGRSDAAWELTQQADSGRRQPRGSPQTPPQSEVDADASPALSHRSPEVSTAHGSLEAAPGNQLLPRKWCEEGTFQGQGVVEEPLSARMQLGGQPEAMTSQ